MIIGSSTIGKFLNLMIRGVLFVDDLKHDLISIIQLCDKVNNVNFDSFGCRVLKYETNQTLFL